MSEAQPIIATLQLDAKSDAVFQAQRRKYFPPQINYVGAHLTLFHNLPGPHFNEVLKVIGRCCAERKRFALEITELLKLGRGVAYKVEAQALMDLRAELAREFHPWLIRQDRQGFRPHITIQNKVAPHEAAALFDHLNTEFMPFSATAEGVRLWFYEGGPNRPGTWAPAGAIIFGE